MPYGYTQPTGWKATRRRILARDGHACHLCGAPAHEVDHILSVGQGGGHEDTNLAAICTPHHEAKSKAERVAGQRAARRRKLEARTEQHPGTITSA